MILVEDRTLGDISLPVALTTFTAAYPTIYSVQLEGLSKGQVVHITGQYNVSTVFEFDGAVLLGAAVKDDRARLIIPYAGSNTFPLIHHELRTFSVYDVPNRPVATYNLILYATSSSAANTPYLMVHRSNGYMQAVAFDVPPPQPASIDRPDLEPRIASLEAGMESVMRDTGALTVAPCFTVDTLSEVIESIDECGIELDNL